MIPLASGRRLGWSELVQSEQIIRFLPRSKMLRCLFAAQSSTTVPRQFFFLRRKPFPPFTYSHTNSTQYINFAFRAHFPAPVLLAVLPRSAVVSAFTQLAQSSSSTVTDHLSLAVLVTRRRTNSGGYFAYSIDLFSLPVTHGFFLVQKKNYCSTGPVMDCSD